MLRTPLLTVFLLSSLFLFSQNSPPAITNLSVGVNQGNEQITLTFDLSDNESDDVEISVKLSDDGGESFLAEVLNVQGDAGYPVSPGVNKQLTFNYATGAQPSVNWQVKVIADDRQPVDIQQIVDMVDSTRLRNDLTFIEGIRHYQADTVHLEAVKNFIENKFSMNGLHTYRQNFVHANYNAANIIGRHGGAKDEKVTYIVDAHFDSVDDSPGADDNGSGVAGVLEAARILSQFQFEHSVKFIGFDFEETSIVVGLIGSTKYVAEGIKSYEQIKGVFNFEMIGYYSNKANSQEIPLGFDLLFPQEYNDVEADSFRGNFLVNAAITTSDSLKMAFDAAALQHVPALKIISVALPNTPLIGSDFWRSDHASFWTEGYQALMLTDGAEFRNNNYHTPNDTLGALNFTFMSNIVKATVAGVATLAKPVHATSRIAYVMGTGIEDSKPSCEWNVIQSSAGILFYPQKNCAIRNWDISFFDMQGKLIIRRETGSTGYTMIETTALIPGLYFLSASSGEERAVKTVVVR